MGDSDCSGNGESEKAVIDFWSNMIKDPPKQFQRLSVGINGNMDVIVHGTDLLKTLNISPAEKKHHPTIDNFKELQESFSYFIEKGAAAERPFVNKDEYAKIIQATDTMSNVQHHIGGNAALMALNAAVLFPDATVQFVGPVGPRFEDMKPKNIEVPAEAKLPKDEVHLIMEYKKGEKWGDHEAPRANRFIATYDESNAKGIMLETFFEARKKFNPDLILFSGLNIMDGQEHNYFMQFLDKLIALCKEVPQSIPIHLELASHANYDFVKAIVEKVITYNDSIGLNEAELDHVIKSVGGPHPNIFDEETGQPAVHKISDTLLWLLKDFGRLSDKGSGARLSRIHFHCLTYHIMAEEKGIWLNFDQATAAGARVAGLQAGGVSQLESHLVNLRVPSHFKLHSDDAERQLDPKSPVIHWEKDGYQFVFCPVLVIKKPVKTVGVGDAISATGLMYQGFKP